MNLAKPYSPKRLISLYGITIVYCALLAVAAMLMNHDVVFGKKYINNAILLYLASGVFVSFCIALCRQKFPGKRMLALAVAGHIVIILNAVYYGYVESAGIKISDAQYFDIAAISALCAASPFVVPFLGRGGDIAMLQFVRRFMFNGALNGVVAGLLFAGLLVMMECINLLFDASLNLQVDVLALVGCFVLPVMILLRTDVQSLSGQKESDKFMVLTFRLFAFLLCIYLMVLYVYIAKIIICLELPKGKVAMPVICMMALLLIVKFIAYGIERDEKGIDSKFLRLLPWLALPALLLMSVGIGRRVLDYGMTAPRFYVILINIWFYAMCAYMARKERPMPMIISFALSALLFTVGPLSAWRLFN